MGAPPARALAAACPEYAWTHPADGCPALCVPPYTWTYLSSLGPAAEATASAWNLNTPVRVTDQSTRRAMKLRYGGALWNPCNLWFVLDKLAARRRYSASSKGDAFGFSFTLRCGVV